MAIVFEGAVMTSENNKINIVGTEAKYREAGFLRRHYCSSRNSILAVCLTAIFAGGWLILSEQHMSLSKKIFVFLFCCCLYVISYSSSRYYSIRIQLVTKELSALEMGTKSNIFVHHMMKKRLSENRPNYDIFDYCVVAIGIFAALIFFSLFIEVVNYIEALTGRNNKT